MDVIDRVAQLGPSAAYVKQALFDKLIEHKRYIAKHGEDLPEIRAWRWTPKRTTIARSGKRQRTRV
jgi:xylulose-5-phosphate/fructose-6-phosphate phosphoketolase